MLFDIVTDVGVYTAKVIVEDLKLYEELFEPHSKEQPEEEAIFYAMRETATKGWVLFGWTPTDDRHADTPTIFAIEDGKRIISTKLYKEPVSNDLFNADETPTLPDKGKVYEFGFNGEYLGCKIKIEGYAIRTDTGEYLLPLAVNGNPAWEAMKPSALSQQVQLWKSSQGVTPTEYRIISTDVPLENDDAIEYLKDYVQEEEPPTKIKGDGKAKPWSGWLDK
ncbi:MAG: hypothetical protein RSE04_05910 [Hydrogenoanaerobacterium sp.]